MREVSVFTLPQKRIFPILSIYSCKDQAGDSEKEEFRQSESFSSLHHCTDPSSWCLSTAVSLFMFRFRDRSPASLCFWNRGADTQLPTLFTPLYFCVTGIDCFLDSIIQEKRYLCVQILTNVCLCCCCLSATVEGWAGFRILNKLLFSFHTLLSSIFFKTAVLHSCHMVSVESMVLFKNCFYLKYFQTKHYLKHLV